MIRALRRLYYRLVPRYRRLEIVFVPYAKADALIRGNLGKPESEQWVLAQPEEDRNRAFGHAYLERKRASWNEPLRPLNPPALRRDRGRLPVPRL